MNPAYLSWGIISALFTIGLSSDLSYQNAMGRIIGACLGAIIGLISSSLLDGPVIVGLLPAVILANMIARIWPNLRYGAVTAAIVALEPSPELGGALARTGVIVAGTCAGAAASFLIWPVRGRERAEIAMKYALSDCQELLQLIDRGLNSDDHRERSAVHARFLEHLEAARSRVSETRFHPTLESGARLRDAVRGVEDLWHGLVTLDRAVSQERQEISGEALERLRLLVDEVQAKACGYLADLAGAMKEPHADTPTADDVCRAVAEARDHVAELAGEEAPNWPLQGRALHAVIFGLNETERQLLHLSEILLSSKDR